MKTTIMKLGLMLFIVSINLSLKAQSYVPITVTGFNADLIANGSGTVTATTTNGFDKDATDGENYYVSGYSTGSYGLPVSGIINSASTTGVKYQLADYSKNNALLLVTLNQTGTLTFSNPGSFAKLAICAASAGTPDGATAFTARVNFSNSTYTDYNFTVPDWFSSGTYCITGVDRVSRSGTFDNNNANPKMFDCIITLSAADQLKVVSSILITKTGSNDRTGIFAICGVTAVGAPPVVVATAATNITTTGFTANWNAALNATSYIIDVSTSSLFDTYVTGYNNTNVGNVLTKQITGLTAGTTYYYRVRATNASGTGPNSTISVETPGMPDLTTTTVTNITTTTATSGGNVDNDGGSTITARGVCWNTAGTPTINDSKTTNGTGTGSFTSSITGLSSNKTYHIRAYATNATGTSYGTELTFTTSIGTGFDENRNQQISVYPNPATDVFHIVGLSGVSSISLTDLSGRILLLKEVSDNEAVLGNTLPRGIYILKIKNNEGTVERKVVLK